MSDKLQGYMTCKAFLATPAAIALKAQIEGEIGKPAVNEDGLDIWVHPRLAQMLATWLEDPDLIVAVNQIAKEHESRD